MLTSPVSSRCRCVVVPGTAYGVGVTRVEPPVLKLPALKLPVLASAEAAGVAVALRVETSPCWCARVADAEVSGCVKPMPKFPKPEQEADVSGPPELNARCFRAARVQSADPDGRYGEPDADIAAAVLAKPILLSAGVGNADVVPPREPGKAQGCRRRSFRGRCCSCPDSPRRRRSRCCQPALLPPRFAVSVVRVSPYRRA